jgi:site-specific DNA-methyltransferase (adenine-specific)
MRAQGRIEDDGKGRWPANLIHDGSDEVLAAFPETTSGAVKPGTVAAADENRTSYGQFDGYEMKPRNKDSGSAARFFYCAKASKADRGDGNTHPTVKPTALMQYLVRLVTPPGGLVMDPFMGSGSTGKACIREGFRFVGIDMTPEYVEIARLRITHEWTVMTAAAEAASAPSPQRDLFEEVA